MNNKLIFGALFCAMTGLTACQSTTTTQPAQKTIHPTLKPRLGGPNPASAYCVEKGGKLSIKTDADGGQRGLCTLSNGKVVDEWDYYRKSNTK